ncbi:hypothetical protein HGM15179_018149, partial [Zosterops borbonicus]
MEDNDELSQGDRSYKEVSWEEKQEKEPSQGESESDNELSQGDSNEDEKLSPEDSKHDTEVRFGEDRGVEELSHWEKDEDRELSLWEEDKDDVELTRRTLLGGMESDSSSSHEMPDLEQIPGQQKVL